MKLLPSWAGLTLRARLLWRVLWRPTQLHTLPLVSCSPFEFLRPLVPDLPALPPALSARTVPDDPTAAYVQSSEPEVAELLFVLARLLTPATITEVGVYRGFTSEYLAAALPPAGRLHLLDVSAEALECGRRSAARQGQQPVLHLGLSTDPAVVGRLPDGQDLVYLDADHSREGVRRELELWLPKLRPGGLVAIHDSVGYDGICRTLNGYSTRYPAVTFATPRGCGLTILRRVSE